MVAAAVKHRATCNCGRLEVICDGDPVRVSLCHCLECQRRTGSVFGAQAWFERQNITSSGSSTPYARASESGARVTFQFCPACGSTVYWQAERFPALVAVAVGGFADPGFAQPQISVWEKRRHSWVSVPEGSERTD
jgi:hypothetical protein